MLEFSNEEIKRAQQAQDLHRAMGFPAYKRFLWLLKNKVNKTQVTWDDAKIALRIYEDEVAIIKGKTVQKTQDNE